MATHGNKGFTPRMRRRVRFFTCQVPGCEQKQETAHDLDMLREKTRKRYGVKALICFEHYERGNFDWVKLEVAVMESESQKARDRS